MYFMGGASRHSLDSWENSGTSLIRCLRNAPLLWLYSPCTSQLERMKSHPFSHFNHKALLVRPLWLSKTGCVLGRRCHPIFEVTTIVDGDENNMLHASVGVDPPDNGGASKQVLSNRRSYNCTTLRPRRASTGWLTLLEIWHPLFWVTCYESGFPSGNLSSTTWQHGMKQISAIEMEEISPKEHLVGIGCQHGACRHGSDTAKGQRHVCSKPESAVNTSHSQGDRPREHGWAGLTLSTVTYGLWLMRDVVEHLWHWIQPKDADMQEGCVLHSKHGSMHLWWRKQTLTGFVGRTPATSILDTDV